MTDNVLNLQSYRETLPIIFSKNVLLSNEYFDSGRRDNKPESLYPHVIFNLRSIVPGEWLACVRSVRCSWGFPTFATDVRNPWEPDDLAGSLIQNLKLTFPGIKRLSLKIRTNQEHTNLVVRTKLLSPIVELSKHYDMADPIVLDVNQEIYDRINQILQQPKCLPPATQSERECRWPVERDSGKPSFLVVRQVIAN